MNATHKWRLQYILKRSSRVFCYPEKHLCKHITLLGKLNYMVQNGEYLFRKYSPNCSVLLTTPSSPSHSALTTVHLFSYTFSNHIPPNIRRQQSLLTTAQYNMASSDGICFPGKRHSFAMSNNINRVEDSVEELLQLKSWAGPKITQLCGEVAGLRTEVRQLRRMVHNTGNTVPRIGMSVQSPVTSPVRHFVTVHEAVDKDSCTQDKVHCSVEASAPSQELRDNPDCCIDDDGPATEQPTSKIASTDHGESSKCSGHRPPEMRYREPAAHLFVTIDDKSGSDES